MSRPHSFHLALVALAFGGLLMASTARAQQAPQNVVPPTTEAENVQQQAAQTPEQIQPLPAPAQRQQPGQQQIQQPGQLQPLLQPQPAAQPGAPQAGNPQHAGQPRQQPQVVQQRTADHQRAQSGVQPARVAPEQLGMNFEEDNDANLRLGEVPEDSAAAELGLKAGDEIVSLGGQDVRDAKSFSRTLQRSLHAGQRHEHIRLPMVIRRDGSEQTIYWTNGALAMAGYGPLLIQYGYYVPPQFITGYRGYAADPAYQDDDRPSIPYQPSGAYLGVELNAQFPQAAIVSAVTEGSAAEQAGIEEGDRIFGINNQRIDSIQELIYVVGQMQPGDEVSIHFDRSHTASVTLGERPMDQETRTGFQPAPPPGFERHQQDQRQPRDAQEPAAPGPRDAAAEAEADEADEADDDSDDDDKASDEDDDDNEDDDDDD